MRPLIASHQNFQKAGNQSTNSRQISKVSDASTDDQSLPDDGAGISQQLDSNLKLNIHSKKINKERYLIQHASNQDKLNHWKSQYLHQGSANLDSVPKPNYSSLGNENSNNFESDLPCFRSISEAPTEFRSKSVSGIESFEAYKETITFKASDEKPSKSNELNPIDLIFDDSSDELESDLHSVKPFETLVKQEHGRNSHLEQRKLEKNDKLALEEYHIAEVTVETMGSAIELETLQIVSINIESNSQDKPEVEESEIDEVDIGEEYQCSIPPLMDRTEIQQNRRSFKLVSGPSVIDPKVLETIESYACKDLKVTNVSSEKLVRMLREFDFKIPEFFAELHRDKEKTKARITWKKERGRVL